MLARGGVVVVPHKAYVRRLQEYYRQGHYDGHAYLLYPGLAHVSAARDADVDALMNAIVAMAADSDSLAGLESLLLSCLQAAQLRAEQLLAVRGLELWDRYRPERLETPLVVADRSKNSLTYFPSKYTTRALKSLTTRALTQKTVGQILSGVQAAVNWDRAHRPDEVDAPDDGKKGIECKDRWTAILSIVGGVAGAGYAAVKIGADGGGKTVGPDLAEGLGITGGLAALGAGIAVFACAAHDAKAAEDADAAAKAEKAISDGLAAAATDAEAAARFINSMNSAPGDYPTPDNATVGDWFNANDSSAPPPAPTDPNDNKDDNQPRDDDGVVATADAAPAEPEQTEWAMPNPDDAGETHGHPPGIHWPTPGDYLPPDDDSGPSGPQALPNGAIFVPTSALTRLARASRMVVTSRVVSDTSAPVKEFQAQTASWALGAGSA
jgi:hypothetical protein